MNQTKPTKKMCKTRHVYDKLMFPVTTKSKRLRSQGNKTWCHLKIHHYLSMHVKYEVSFSYDSKIMVKAKVFFATDRGQKVDAPEFHSDHKNQAKVFFSDKQ